jgi:RNA polymerase sigma factor (sigma-70 family)
MPPPAEGFAARFVIGPALRTQPDRRLVTLIREGYENAFEEIVRRYGRPLTRYAAAIVGARAEDVTQDAFSKALLALRRGGAEIELRPWLFRIVRNTALNDLRDSPPSAEALAEVIASGDSPAEELERREELADLMRRLQSLPEAQRAAIVMRELEGLSHEEIASALGLSNGGARQAIYRARRSLRNAAGMLLPLPLLKGLLTGATGSPAVETAAGAAGVGGAASAGVALKAAVATVLVAGALGTGVAIDHSRRQQQPAQSAASGLVADDPAQTTHGIRMTTGGDPGGNGSSSASGRGGERERGDDHGGRGRGSGESGDGGENRGPGGGGGNRHSELDDDHGDRPQGSGRGSSGPGGSDDGGGGHSGRSSGGSSGPGGGGSPGGDGRTGDDGGSGSSSGPGSGSLEESSGSSTGSGSGSDSGSGSGSSGGSGSGDGGSGSGGESGAGEPNFDDSGDSLGGSGFSVQTEPETQEES